MPSKYLKYIPVTLLEDLVENRVIPFVGAGFSKNAVLPANISIPTWYELGRHIAKYIPDYEYNNALDALSIFETEFTRVKLIEAIAKELCIYDIKPGDTHRNFCNLLFDVICTTNFDFLLEHTLNERRHPFSTIVSEDRLPIYTKEKTRLVKLHGDFNHPNKMVITENDYDTYLENNKILATYVSNLFITNSLLLLGYSFDDNDIRSLWQIINSRLGRLSCPAYTVMVNASTIEVSRFERRKIKVINLPGKASEYSSILAQLFIEIKEYIDERAPQRIVATKETTTEELHFPKDDNNLCFISAPFSRISFLKELLYPILLEYGIAPVTIDEVIMPGDMYLRKIETLIKQSYMAIVDLSGNNSNVMWELGVLTNQNKKVICIVDSDEIEGLPSNVTTGLSFLSYNTVNENDEFVNRLSLKIEEVKKSKVTQNVLEHQRLMKKKEYNAAIISAFRILETKLSVYTNDKVGMQPIYKTLRSFRNNNPEHEKIIGRIIEYYKIRNEVVHTDYNVSARMASNIIKAIEQLCELLEEDTIRLKNN